jgi:hypothetical protein
LAVAREDERIAGALSLNQLEHGDDCEQAASRFYSGARTKPPQSFTADDVMQFRSDASTGAGTVAFSTARPLISEGECKAVIEEAESVAAGSGGWNTKRHSNYPTTDIPVLSLPATKRWVDEALETRIFPFLAHCFPQACADADSFRVNDVFVVKYNASSGQTQLKNHRDGGLISINIALNSQEDFSGGGTALFCNSSDSSEQVALMERGHMLAHSSSVMHAGRQIQSGVRYVLVAFVISATQVEHRRRMTERAQLMLKEGMVVPAMTLMLHSIRPEEEEEEREGRRSGGGEGGPEAGVEWVGGSRAWGDVAYGNNVGPAARAASRFEEHLSAQAREHSRRMQVWPLTLRDPSH